MGKICDPPPFTGGQCPTRYVVSGIISQFSSDGSFLGDQPFGAVVGGPLDNVRSYSNEYVPGNMSNSLPKNGFTIGYLMPGVHYIFFARFPYGGQPTHTLKQFNFYREDGQPDNCGDPPPINCRCSDDSCRVDCAGAPDGFCCIDHALTNRLLQVLQN